MSKCLITGCEGFIGSHMADYLLKKGMDVYASVYDADTRNIEHLRDNISIVNCDIRDSDRLAKIMIDVKPDYVFHFAAQSLVIPSWQDTKATLDIDVLGTFYVLDSIKKADVDPIVIIACSSAEYGLNYPDEIPVKETKEFRPSSPYGVSKIGTDMFAYLFWQAYQMRVMRIRPFNITGPRKKMDACSDFARGIVAIEYGKAKILDVGNLETIRDITDFRDGIKAIWLIAEKGTPGEVYNICRNRGYKMRDILDQLVALSNTQIKVRQIPNKMRPLDDSVQIGDNSKLRSLGWSPEIPLQRTLSDILDYWRLEDQK